VQVQVHALLAVELEEQELRALNTHPRYLCGAGLRALNTHPRYSISVVQCCPGRETFYGDYDTRVHVDADSHGSNSESTKSPSWLGIYQIVGKPRWVTFPTIQNKVMHLSSVMFQSELLTRNIH
jgi:hypothetical protein